MLSTSQQIFKQMSNRTRSRPLEIYTKLNTHLAQLHDQVSQFNKTSHTVHAITRNSRYSDSSSEIRLKAMTQPKYQELLLNCELPFSDKHTKTGKLQRKISTKTGKEFKSFGLTSSLNSCPGIRAKVQSKLANIPESMVGNKTRLRSTMIQTATSGVVPHKFSQREAMVNASMVESVLIPNSSSSPMKTETETKRRKHSKTLREKIQEKQLKLEMEWEKTQRYQGRVSNYLGEGELQRVNIQRSTFAMTRIVNVIDKIKRSRIATAGGLGCECIELEHSQTL